MFCDQCGCENRNDRKFCQNCGAPLKNYTRVQENLLFDSELQAEQEIVKKRNNIKKLTNILLFIFFMFAVALTIVAFFVYDVLFWIVVGLSLAFYIAMFITIIIRHNLFKYLKNK